jgi:hypothetical protein
MGGKGKKKKVTKKIMTSQELMQEAAEKKFKKMLNLSGQDDSS